MKFSAFCFFLSNCGCLFPPVHPGGDVRPDAACWQADDGLWVCFIIRSSEEETSAFKLILKQCSSRTGLLAVTEPFSRIKPVCADWSTSHASYAVFKTQKLHVWSHTHSFIEWRSFVGSKPFFRPRVSILKLKLLVSEIWWWSDEEPKLK